MFSIIVPNIIYTFKNCNYRFCQKIVIYFILFNVAKEKNTMYVGSIHQNKHQILSIMLISHRVILCTLTIMC